VRNVELQCLRHLRELKADGNQLTSLDGLERMDGLVKLSVQGNAIRDVDLEEFRWCVSPVYGIPVEIYLLPWTILGVC
jgi:hypothetical protein